MAAKKKNARGSPTKKTAAKKQPAKKYAVKAPANRKGAAADGESSRAAAQARRGKIVRWAKVIAAVWAALHVLFAAGLAAWYFTGGGWFGILPYTCTVTVGEDTYTQSGGGIDLISGTEFTVKRYFGESYSVTVTLNGETDFSFSVGGDGSWTWSALESYGITDFTPYFTIEETDGGFTVSYESLGALIGAALGGDVTVTAEPEGDIFDLTVSCARRTIVISFYITDTLVNRTNRL